MKVHKHKKAVCKNFRVKGALTFGVVYLQKEFRRIPPKLANPYVMENETHYE